MDIIVSPDEVDLLECEVLVCGFFEDERPLRGSCGWVDWRLNGRISHFIEERKLIGRWEEVILIPTQGRLQSSFLLLFGLGKVREYSYLRVREMVPFLLRPVKRLSVSKVSFSLPYHEDYHVDCGKLIEVLLEGIADCLELEPFDSEQDWIKNLQLFFGEGEGRFSEILFGVKTAKLILNDRISIRILVPAETTPSPSIEVY
jgi:hypothetical protein